MKRILIVEDVDLNLELLVQLLEDEYELATAGDGEQGVAVARSERPDLILMDMSLPVVDGWEATRRIKAIDTLKNVPIIALTAHAMAEHIQQCQHAGMDLHLAKPVSLATLKIKLRDCAKQAESQALQQ